jgi:NAD(P)-dependent dehydrogenase (short-subunit alcohol dehydrogenase family)
MEISLTGKAALVTGGGAGISKAIVEAYDGLGACGFRQHGIYLAVSGKQYREG